MKLLHVDSSVLAANSVSRQLTARIVAQWQATHPGTTVEYLDLGANAPAHFGPESLGYRLGIDASQLTEAQKRENAVTDAFLTQFLAADVIVVGAPLYNFTIPSQLKAWIDRLAQAGRTFKYTETGPVGLAGGKTVIVASSRGGIYSTSDAGQAAEHQESYLKVVFGFFGITDVRFVRAEGVGLGEASKTAALATAEQQIVAEAA
ncbi:MAG: FMN-dependent NADH-azoreductase [Burkholderiales bacterium]|jgi:FMN-dependent NADH-azoreductase|nr:FMN-dependent NADH-azoreductase [Burkholderiales bacterium]